MYKYFLKWKKKNLFLHHNKLQNSSLQSNLFHRNDFFIAILKFLCTFATPKLSKKRLQN